MIRGRDDNGYELRAYRVVWAFRIGTIGDSVGRTWSKDIISEAKFPTYTAAALHREHHPDMTLDQWGQWRTKNIYGLSGIFRVEEEIDWPKDDL